MILVRFRFLLFVPCRREVRPDLFFFDLFGYFHIDERRLIVFAQVLPNGNVQRMTPVIQNQN